ncbi:MAG: protein-glutamate O-methyltransferase CheR, partial [Desulfobacterales bacterium]|nr:protein-glutamate O-methyltransferase CheR [Desulfobacterales bacterium]
MIEVQSQPDANALALSPHGAHIRRLILERCGLYFRDHERKGLDKAVCSRMESVGVFEFSDYLKLLKNSQEEFCELLNLLTVRHTYFFRNEPQFNALEQTILPTLIKEKRQQNPPGGPTLNIWSAGCSTGEEPYSLAMAVTRAIPDIDKWHINIHATDVSTQALASAQTGCFQTGSMQLVSDADRVAYFEETISADGQHRFQVREKIRKLVQFRYLNLQEDDYPENMDLIFCRNVMIYFDRDTVCDMVRRFYRSLRIPGYFFIGYAETLQGVSSEFKLTLDHEGVFYCKMDPAQAAVKKESASATKTSPMASSKTVPASVKTTPVSPLVAIE